MKAVHTEWGLYCTRKEKYGECCSPNSSKEQTATNNGLSCRANCSCCFF